MKNDLVTSRARFHVARELLINTNRKKLNVINEAIKAKNQNTTISMRSLCRKDNYIAR